MMFDKKKELINICYASSDEYAQYTGISLLSLLENNSSLINKVFILSFNIKEDNREKILEIGQKYKKNIVFIDALKKMGTLFEEIGLATFEESYATYARAFISLLIEDDEYKLLYIDSDTVVDGSIEELVSLEMDIPEKVYAAAIGVNQYFIDNQELDLKNGNTIYYACGVMVFNLKLWKKHQCTEKIIEYISKNGATYKYADQTVINNTIPQDLVLAMHPKYNYWGHIFRNERIIYELQRGGFYKRKFIKETIKNRVIIHYKGAVVHPWLKGNASSLSDVYHRYKEMSPWKEVIEQSIYYNEFKKCEVPEEKEMIDNIIAELHKPAIGFKIIEKMRLIKRALIG